MDWAKIAEWTALAVGVVAGGFLGWKEWRERKFRSEKGMAANPTRCDDHETRLRHVESACLYMGPQITNIETDITEIKGDIKSLITMHLQK